MSGRDWDPDGARLAWRVCETFGREHLVPGEFKIARRQHDGRLGMLFDRGAYWIHTALDNDGMSLVTVRRDGVDHTLAYRPGKRGELVDVQDLTGGAWN